MKTLYLICILSLVIVPALAQKKEDSEMLQRDLTAYQRAIQNLDVDSMLYFMPPKLFEFMPREVLRTQLESIYKDEEFSVSNLNFTFDSKPKIKKTGKYKWSVIDYEGAMTMTVHGERDSSFAALFLGMMKLQFGVDNVKMQNDSTFDIAMKNKKMIAFKDPELPTWKFLEDKRKRGEGKEEMLAQKVFEAALPPEVLKAIDKN